MTTADNCFNCVYSYWDPCQIPWSLSIGWPVRLACANHPDSPGRMRALSSGRVCRNYRPRPATPEGDVKQIDVGDGFSAYVDAADYEWLSQWTWTFHSGYAVRYEKKKQIYMHREIMQPPPGMVVDHKNRNKLDNTRVNLWVCTPRENAQNRRKPRGSASRFMGAGYDYTQCKWYANLYVDGRQIWLGYQADELEAARAYDRKAVERLGERARLNFPEEWPPERIQEVHIKPPAEKPDTPAAQRPPRKRRRTPTESKRGQDAHATN